MGAIQVVEMPDQRLDPGTCVERFQHVVAHEVREVAHRFHRHRLVEQFQCLIILDAEVPLEPCPIRGKAVGQLASCDAQPLAQGGDLAAKAREVLRDRHGPLRGHEQARRLACGSFSQNTCASVTVWS